MCKKINYKFYTDPSFLVLIIANGFVAYQATTEKWQIVNLLAIYLGQSIIIGIFNYLNLRALEKVKTKDSFQHFDSSFFAMHFGIFHFVYLIFVIVYSFILGKFDSFQVALGVFVFLLNHTYSYFFNQKNLQGVDSSLLMFLPYTRVLPMHIVIIVAMIVGKDNSLWLFMCLKIFADIISHIIQRNMISKSIRNNQNSAK